MRRRTTVDKGQSSRKAEILQTMPLKQVFEKAEKMKMENFREAIVFLNSQIEARQIELVGLGIMGKNGDDIAFRPEMYANKNEIQYNMHLLNEIALINDKKMEISWGYAFTAAFR